MSNKRLSGLAMTALLLLGSTVVFLQPLATGQGTQSWSAVTIPTGGNSVTDLYTATRAGTDEIGLAYLGGGSGKILFDYLATGNGAWVLKSSNVCSACGAASEPRGLVALDNHRWAMLVVDPVAGTYKTMRSTDEGATWTQVNANLGGANNGLGSHFQMQYLGGDNLALLESQAGVVLRHSYDAGTTWPTGAPDSYALNDNQGGSSAQSATASTPVAYASFYVNPVNVAEQSVLLYASTAANLYLLSAVDGGSFWTTPYTTNGGSTLRSADAVTTSCPNAYSQGVGLSAGHWMAMRANSANSNRWYACVDNVPYPSTTESTTYNAPLSGVGMYPIQSNGVQTLFAISDAANSRLHVYYKTTGTATEVYTSPTGSGVTNQFNLRMGATYTHAIYPDNNLGGQLRDARAEYFPPTTATTGSVPPITIAGITGMRVDPTGNTLIIRQNENVRTYAAGTLAALGVSDTYCNIRLGGIASAASHVLYLACDPDDADVVQSFNIRSPSLGTPTQPSVCNGAGFCLTEIPDAAGIASGALAGNHDGDIHLASFEHFPITYSNYQDGFLDDDAVWMAFAFTTLEGKVGVVTYVMNNDGTDKSDAATYSIAGQAPDQMCLVRDTRGTTAGNSYLYASSTSSNVRGFRVDFANGHSATNEHSMIPTLASVFAGTQATAGARGIACGEGKFAILGNTSVTIWNRTADQPYITTTVGISAGNTPASHAIIMSSDGGWVFYRGTDDRIHMVNTTTGTTLPTSIIAPTGTFIDLQTHGHGCTIWYSTQGTVDAYNLVGTTCPRDTAYNDPQSGEDGNTADFTDDNHNGIPDSQEGGASTTITFADGLCIVCALVNDDTFVVLDKTFAYIVGFLFFAASVVLSIWLARRNNTQLATQTSGAISASGMGGAYVFFAFPLFIIVLAALIAGAAILVPKRS
ncbi:MAG TPA: hypothetical protein VM286_04345 [Candidatus Thermoplasmatota archaeon]|nr:hypothetical protein [Candidatus Thermoplasmatota archaeon]